ncbi:hypothetical protein ASPCADRAFT_202894 [Aspergillus carbonarius ITEM 5010]|uniref:Uncharacterized protein n=1 Tax=Aspergillus carbonarius (strain ITEM 5010) TaxID=602072 RepID=A0A1R3S2S2_ASPC5|nr:hypothetical protein ASPCADRAFT_202894 [Aspergillus carbonarius ITEM 5010]
MGSSLGVQPSRAMHMWIYLGEIVLALFLRSHTPTYLPTYLPNNDHTYSGRHSAGARHATGMGRLWRCALSDFSHMSIFT